MTIVLIPEEKKVICDICKEVNLPFNGNRKMSLSHTISDVHGNACACDSQIFDICDKCFSRMYGVID